MKCSPSKLIWKVELSDPQNDYYTFQSFYFIFYKSAKKFVESHADELSKYHVTIGGESLLFSSKQINIPNWIAKILNLDG